MVLPQITPVVSLDEVDRLMADGSVPVVLADVRWYLDGRDGRAAWLSGHLPGSVWIDLEGMLSGHGRPITDGRHPLPSPAAFAAAMGSIGVDDDTVVIAYDDTGGLSAGRLVVMLRMLGRRSALLDGGIAAWTASGRSLAVGEEPALPTRSFTEMPWPDDRLADADAVASHVERGGVLLDARPRERFTGEVASVDPRPGHVPGATSAPWSAVLGADGRFRAADDLATYYSSLGATTNVVVSCGSGVSACMNVLGLERAGLPLPRLFVASWSGWASDPDRPVATGPGR